MVSIEITGCATELGCQDDILQTLQLRAQTIDIHHHLFSQTCGRCWLSVCLGQHRDIFPSLSILGQLIDQLLQQRHIHFMERLFDREGHTGVVNILRGKTKVDKLLVVFEATYLVQFLLDEILNSFYIVIGYLLDILHALCIILGKITIDST